MVAAGTPNSPINVLHLRDIVHATSQSVNGRTICVDANQQRIFLATGVFLFSINACTASVSGIIAVIVICLTTGKTGTFLGFVFRASQFVADQEFNVFKTFA